MHRLCALIFTVFAVIAFLSPEMGQAATLQKPMTPGPPQANPSVSPAATTENRRLQAPVGSVSATSAQSAAAPSFSPAPVRESADTSPAKTAGSTLPLLLQQPQSQPALPPQPPQSRQSLSTSQTGRYGTIDFDNVDIRVFIKFVSELTGRNFLLDERVKGKVTVISSRKIAAEDVYNVFQSILEIYGFTAVEAGEVIKVIPSVDARGKNLETRLTRDEAAPEDKLVTQIISLQNASPDEMKKILDPLISKSSIILAYAPTGMLIITDVQSNVKRLQEIVTALDVRGVGEVISYIPLRAALATEIVKSLIAVFPPQRPGSLPIRIVADDRTNSIILLASEQSSGHIKKLISLMDKDIPRVGNVLHVYRLQNGNAEDMVKVLMNIPKETTAPRPPAQAGAAAAVAKTPVLSKDLNVVADKATNTLIITADTG